jgi:RND superfamily putative drug exporter
MEPHPERPLKNGGGFFEGLARWVVRHPWHPVIFWIVLLLVTVPFLPLLGSVTTNSATSLPSNSPSGQASAELARLFPSDPGASSTQLLLYGPNLTDANAQRVILNVTAAISSDGSLADVTAVTSVYSEYASFLAGQAELAAGVLQEANQSAQLLWGTPALFVSTWTSLVQNGTCPGNSTDCNHPAYQATASALGKSTASLAVLSAFYNGYDDSGAGFNSTTAGCASDPATVINCTDAAARANEGPLIPSLVSDPSEQAVPRAVLGVLAINNFSFSPHVPEVLTVVLAAVGGLPSRFLGLVWNAFPGGFPDSSAPLAWANAAVVNATLATEPLPVPYAIYSQFVAAAGTATIVEVDFSVTDDYTDASGGQPVYSDLGKLDILVPSVVHSSDPTKSISYVQTGSAPLDLLTQTAVNSSIALVLPLTVGLLLAIAMLYFRSPVTPLVTFAGLGIALVLGLGATVLVGTVVGHVDTTSITLEEVFVLGVGTDYAIFLVARYREELVLGKSSDEALVTAVSWAGRSVATSGSAAIIATLALTFSGVALLSQWGSVLSLAVFITLALSLTLIPAFLKLLGPRIFWPYTGPRFDRHATVLAGRLRREDTYFYRAGRATQRRPWTFVTALLVISIPLVAVALTAPVAYDFYQQLPSGHPATDGLTDLGNYFGPGFAVPSFALVTFSASLVGANNTTNAAEFTDIAALTARAEGTSGVAVVQSPVGAFGTTLANWLNLSTLPVGARANLLGTLSGFVGTDGRTVLFDLQPSATGLSLSAVTAVRAVESSWGTYVGSHPEIVQTAYGGGAPVIYDLSEQTAAATNLMIIAVTIGLVIVLLAVLRSWIIALMGVATIGLSISWAWAVSDLVFQQLLGFPLFFYVRTILFIFILGLGIDYNIFLLTRIREERVRGRSNTEAAVEGVARTGGIITAAAVILASAFGALLVGSFTLIRAIGFSVAVAVILDAMVVRTYLVPASLQVLGERVWTWTGRRPKAPAVDPGAAPNEGRAPSSAPADPEPTG